MEDIIIYCPLCGNEIDTEWDEPGIEGEGYCEGCEVSVYIDNISKREVKNIEIIIR